MHKNILVDLNIILDVLLERPGYKASQAILEIQSPFDYTLFISAHAVTTFAYLLENAKVPKKEIIRYVNWLLQTFSVVATNDGILENALKSHITDYEDAVVEQAALDCGASIIITRNVNDFRQSMLPATTPEEFISSNGS
ncbi:MAG TPA: PIN domain-containing protein [Candidatus Saccharimonadales bacterium]|nr:PIN domain-containing protein [Candidatus Saccharimonadales bacterium]